MISEDKLQQDCFKWHWNNYPEYRTLLFHVKNEGAKNKVTAYRDKLKGLITGVSDLIYLYNGKTYLIELKTPIGKQSKNQIKWQNIVTEHDFSYSVIRTIEEFKELIHKIHDNS